MCESSVLDSQPHNVILCKVPSPEPFLKLLAQAHHLGVLMNFMGCTMSASLSSSWSVAALGPGKVTSFVFLGKGFYYARCEDSDTVYSLGNSAGIHGAGFFAYAMLWDPMFDPAHSLIHFCPVWVILRIYLYITPPHSLHCFFVGQGLMYS